MIYDTIYCHTLPYINMYSVDVIPYSQLLAQVVGVFPGARMNDGTEAFKVGRGVKPQTLCRLTHVPLFACLFVCLVGWLFVCFLPQNTMEDYCNTM